MEGVRLPAMGQLLSSIFPMTLQLSRGWAYFTIWLCMELLFYAIVNRVIRPRVEPLRKAPPNPLPPKECVARVIDCLKRLKGVYTPEQFWSGWFKGANPREIGRENVKDFLAWAAWHCTVSELSEDDLTIANGAIAQVEKFQGWEFPSGFNDEVEHVAFTWEPLTYSHRGLFFYAALKAFEILGTLVLITAGFTRYMTSNGVTYWHRKSRERGPVCEAPLVFFHGISPGLWCYIPFLFKLAPRRELLVFEVPHITTTLCFEAVTVDDMTTALGEALALHKVEECSVLGHSFGSIVAGWAASEYPNVVRQLVLVDPVCLLLCLPDVAYNFLYRRPPSNPLERSVKDLVDPSSEITVAHALRRTFWWFQKIVWLQDLECDVVVALSSMDDIVPSAAIKAYVQRHYDLPGEHSTPWTSPVHHSSTAKTRRGSTGAHNQKIGLCDARLIYWQGLGHGGMLISSAAQEELFDAMRTQARDNGLVRTKTPQGAYAAPETRKGRQLLRHASSTAAA